MLGTVIRDRYHIDSLLGRGGFSEVYEATDRVTGAPAVVKILTARDGKSNADMALRFQREALTLMDLRHDHIVGLLAFGEQTGLAYIVMEHDNGVSLTDYLRTAGWPTIPESIRAMTQLAEALQYVHEKGIIHQDIKPSNIILRDRRIDQCKLVDFGCALLKRSLRAEATHGVMGTIPYISPEQLRSDLEEVDARSDLYALGVTFYELLTGTSPFPRSESPQEIGRAQMGKAEPPSRCNPVVPEVLDRIALKLIEFDPARRYQSAASLLDDLREYRQQAEGRRGVAFFQVGRADEKRRQLLDDRLVGRTREIAALTAHVRGALDGAGGFVLLGGEAGFGKSRLLGEIRTIAQQLNFACFYAKCSDTAASYPYYPVVQLLQECLEYLRAIPAAQAKPVYDLLREHLSPYATELSEMAPAIVAFLDPTRRQTTDDPAARLPQFLERIALFFAETSKAGRPLLLVVDDIHWADGGTLKWLEGLAPIVLRGSRAVVICAYRSEEVGDRPALYELLKRFERGDKRIGRIPVAPLAPPQVRELLANLLPETADGFRDILQILVDFSRGSPMFILEMLRSYVDERVIRFQDGAWSIAADRIVEPVVGTSLVEIILKRLKHLAPATAAALTTASCIGRTFSRAMLFEIAGVGVADGDLALEEAVRARFIVRRQVTEGDDFSFAHDKIYETFYSSLEPARQQELHLQVARTLEERNRGDLGKHVYALAHHYWRGRDPRKAFDYVTQAAGAARRALALQQAVDFYEQAIALLPEVPEQAGRENELREQLADALTVIGQYRRAISHFRQVRNATKDELRLAALERKIGIVHFRRGEFPDAIERFQAGMKYLHSGLSDRPAVSMLVAGGYMLLGAIRRFTPRTVMLGRFRKRPDALRELVNLHLHCSLALFWVDVNRSVEDHMKCFFYAMLLGPSPELAAVWDHDAAAWLRLGRRRMMFRSVEKSRRICVALHDRLALGNNHFQRGMILQCLGDNRGSLAAMHEAMLIHEAIGAVQELELDLVFVALSHLHLGEVEKYCECTMKIMEMAERACDERGLADSYRDLARYFLLIGNLEEAKKAIGVFYRKIDKDKNPLSYCAAGGTMGAILLSENRLDRAIEFMEEVERIQKGRWLLDEWLFDTHLGLAEAYLRKLEGLRQTVEGGRRTADGPLEPDNRQPSTDNQIEHKRMLARATELQKGAERKARLHRNYLGASVRLRARLQRFQGRNKAAYASLDEAVRVLEKMDMKLELAVTLRLYGQWLASEDEVRASEFASRADELFGGCHAVANVEVRRASVIIADRPDTETPTTAPTK